MYVQDPSSLRMVLAVLLAPLGLLVVLGVAQSEGRAFANPGSGPPTQRSQPSPRVDAGTPFDLQRFLDEQIASGARRIVVPPGRHRVTPHRRVHLALKGLSGIEIVATGAEMVCTETTRALRIDDCKDLTIRGLTIDYDPLPYTQGRIVSLSEDKTVHDVELFEGYPDAADVEASKYEIFRPDTRTLRFGSYHQFRVEVTGARTIRVIRQGRHRGEQVGDLVVIGSRHAPGGQIPHAVTIDDSEGVVLEDVRVHASNCFGFFEVGCTRTVYRRCVVDRRSPDDDLRERADPRIRSLDADAFHSKEALVGPQILQCAARYQADDCVNICGNYHMVMATDGKALRVLAKHRLDILAGDPVELVGYDGRRLPDARAVSTREIGLATEDELAFLSRQRMHGPFKEGGIQRIHEVVLDRAIDLPRGSLVAASNRMGNGFAVVGCDFGFNRSRGILIKASHGEIRGNTLEACQGESIKVAPEFWWLESGSSRNVLITGNVIRNTPADGIAVYAIAGSGGIAPAGALSDIRITDNVLENVGGRPIRVTSTRGLVLSGNSCEQDKVELEECEVVTRDG